MQNSDLGVAGPATFSVTFGPLPPAFCHLLRMQVAAGGLQQMGLCYLPPAFCLQHSAILVLHSALRAARRPQ
jgi:hypothetical protein